MKDWLADSVATMLAVVCRAANRRGRCAPPRGLASARSILVLKMDGLGDFVLVTPFLRELRLAAPRAHITLVTGRTQLSLAAANPHVDTVAIMPESVGPRRFGTLRLILRSTRFLSTVSPGRAFDLALIPRTGRDTRHARLLAYLSGAPSRVGYAADDVPKPSSASLTSSLAYPATPIHEVTANLAILSSLGATVRSDALESHCLPNEESELRILLERAGIGGQPPLIVLGVGASLPHKIWPADRFLRLAGCFRERREGQVVVVGDAADRSRFPGTSDGFHNLAGKLTAAQVGALLRRARLFVGNDSGPLHLACAAGCPCVLVSWDRMDSDPADQNSFIRFQPFGVPFISVHPEPGNSGRDCSLVPYARVEKAAEEMLARPRRETHDGPRLAPGGSGKGTGTLVFFSNTVPLDATGSFVIFRRHLKPLVDSGWKLKVVSYFPAPEGAEIFWEHIQLPLRRPFWPPADPRSLLLMRLRCRLQRSLLVRDGLLDGTGPFVLLSNLWDSQSLLAACFARSGAGRLGTFLHDDEITWNSATLPKRFLAWSRKETVAASDRVWSVSSRLISELDPDDRIKAAILRPIPAAAEGGPPGWRESHASGVSLGYSGKIYPGLWPALAGLVSVLSSQGGSLTVITDPESSAQAPENLGPHLRLLPYFRTAAESSAWLCANCSAVLVAHPLKGALPLGRWQILRSSFPSKLAEFSQIGLPLFLLGNSDSEFGEWSRGQELVPFFTDPGDPAAARYLEGLRRRPDWEAASKSALELARREFDPRAIQQAFDADISALASLYKKLS